MTARLLEAAPFVMGFIEQIDTNELTLPPGKYNPRQQIWEWEGTEGADYQIASFPRAEKPPTVSTVITWLPRPNLPKTDMGPDD